MKQRCNIISFCDEKLNEEYKKICLRLLEKLCRKRPSPLQSGRARTWAAGIVYAIASNNFIFDKTQKISMTAAELAEPFGISPSTAGNKAAEIRKYVNISYFTPEWVLPELTEKNPMTWLLELNDQIVDIRQMPLTIQHEAYAKGLIPYIPGPKKTRNRRKITLKAFHHYRKINRRHRDKPSSFYAALICMILKCGEG